MGLMFVVAPVALIGYILLKGERKPVRPNAVLEACALPPSLMLVTILTLAAFTTVHVTGRISEREGELEIRMDGLKRLGVGTEGWIYMRKAIRKGQVITSDAIEVKKTAPTNLMALVARKYEVVGLRAKRDLQEGEILSIDCLCLPSGRDLGDAP